MSEVDPLLMVLEEVKKCYHCDGVISRDTPYYSVVRVCSDCRDSYKLCKCGCGTKIYPQPGTLWPDWAKGHHRTSKETLYPKNKLQVCQSCKTEFLARRTSKLFCSTGCYDEYRSSGQGSLNPLPEKDFKCVDCGSSFSATRSKKSICSACYARRRENSRLLYKYGVTLEWFESKLQECNSKCEICLNEFSSRRDTHIDHDHETGVVRGLLCGNCNRAVGLFDDSVESLKSAIDYLGGQ